MTKSYEDGIIDAIKIVSFWKGIGLISTPINSILGQLNALLTTASHNISIFDITMDDKKSLENDQLDLIQSFEE